MQERLDMTWDSACPPSCGARHERGWAKNPSYDRRFYYFVGTNGTWVSETDPESDSTAFNRRIKQALKPPDYLSDRVPWPSVFDHGHSTAK
jgi:hypothetical protein